MKRLTANERYASDPAFHTLVDVMVGWLENNPDTTPSELREAALLACQRHEAMTMRYLRFGPPEPKGAP